MMTDLGTVQTESQIANCDVCSVTYFVHPPMRTAIVYVCEYTIQRANCISFTGIFF